MSADERRRLEELTMAAVAWDRRRVKEPAEPPPEGDFIHFLGTGGNPINLVSQDRQTGGFYISLAGSRLYVDPGPGAIFHAARAGLPLGYLDGIFISHGHTDHYLEAGAMIEAMCRIMSAKRGRVLAPRELFRRGLIPAYYLGEEETGGYPGGPEAIPLGPGETVRVGALELTTVRAFHGPENYGFVLRGGGVTVGYTSDTSYIRSYRTTAGEMREVRPGEPLADFAEVVEYRESLREAWRGVDVLVANMSYYHHFPHRHLTAYGLIHLLRGSDIGSCLITHVDPCLFRPVDYSAAVVELIARESGVPCRLAQDNARYPLP